MILEQLAWNCAGRYQRATQVVPIVSFAQLCFSFNILYSGLLKSQCESVHLVLGAYCKLDLIVWVHKSATVQVVAILEVLLYNLIHFCYTFAPFPHGEKVWKNQVMQLCFIFLFL